MYKRRDWLHLHGADGGQSSGSDSSDDSDAPSQGMERLACCARRVWTPFAQPRRDRMAEGLLSLRTGGADAEDDQSSADEETAGADTRGRAHGRRSEDGTDSDADGSDGAEDPDAAGAAQLVRSRLSPVSLCAATGRLTLV